MCDPGQVCDPVDGCVVGRPCALDAECDDGVFCNGAEVCDPVRGCTFGPTTSCDDGLACTMDSCDDAMDACVHVSDDLACADGLMCNGAERCDPAAAGHDAAGCVAGPAMACDDGIACTIDRCDETMGGCVGEADDGRCADAIFCDGLEVCDPARGCVDGTPPACDDGVACTTGRCDAATDRCAQTPSDAACGDGLVCNGSERCDTTLGCVPGTRRDCSDGIACTSDACVEPGMCTHGGSDADGDGHVVQECPGGDDCDDTMAGVFPGATEVCDGSDNDCNGIADDGPMMQCVLGSPARLCTTACGTTGTQG
jgi:hypothetical protein